MLQTIPLLNIYYKIRWIIAALISCSFVKKEINETLPDIRYLKKTTSGVHQPYEFILRHTPRHGKFVSVLQIHMTRFFTFLFLIFPSLIHAQGIRIGEWRNHFSYTNGLKAVEVKDKIYCITDNGMFLYDRTERAEKLLSKTDGFTDVNATAIAYDSLHDALFIGYKDGYLDIVQGNNIYSRSEIATYSGSINHDIYDFYFRGDSAYISTSFGVVVYQLKNNMGLASAKETWKITGFVLPINSVTILGDSIYVSNGEEIRKAWLHSSNLEPPSEWKVLVNDTPIKIFSFANKLWSLSSEKLKYWKSTGGWELYIDGWGNHLNSAEICHGNLIVNSQTKMWVIKPDLIIPTSNGVNGNNNAIVDKDGNFWYAHSQFTLLRYEGGELSYLQPNGPTSLRSYSMISYGNNIWVAPGSVSSTWQPLYYNDGFYNFDGKGWNNYNSGSLKSSWPEAGFKDILNLTIDSNNRHIWAGSFVNGLLEFDGKEIIHYDSLKSGGLLKKSSRISGLCFDKNKTLWINNFSAQNGAPLIAKTSSGNWIGFDVGGNNNLATVISDDYNQLWMTRPAGGDNILVYNYGKNLTDKTDDQYKVLTTAPLQGHLPTAQIHALVKDKNGAIWIGTDDGVAVCNSPGYIFSDYEFDFTQPFIENADVPGYLLSGQSVTCIAIDGANRKWIGTRRGAYLTNEDGNEILLNFTTTNSPLVSDNIVSIGINGITGEVFFGTDKGIQSFRSTATEGKSGSKDVFAFPNPVSPEYKGPIAIKGLASNSIVKITDANGRLVFETKSEGGQAIWYGKNFKGEDANSGVYLVFSTTEDGVEQVVTKILLVR